MFTNPTTNNPTTNANQLAEAAIKMSLLFPDQFQLPLPARPDLAKEETRASSLTHPPPDSQADSSQTPASHKLEHTVSGNSSPSREVANILEGVMQYQDQEQEVEDVEEEGEEDISPPDRTFKGTKVWTARPLPSV